MQNIYLQIYLIDLLAQKMWSSIMVYYFHFCLSVDGTVTSSPESECASCRQQGMQIVKLWSYRILQLLTGGCRLMQVVLYNGCKTMVVVVLVFISLLWCNWVRLLCDGGSMWKTTSRLTSTGSDWSQTKKAHGGLANAGTSMSFSSTSST